MVVYINRRILNEAPALKIVKVLVKGSVDGLNGFNVESIGGDEYVIVTTIDRFNELMSRLAMYDGGGVRVMDIDVEVAVAEGNARRMERVMRRREGGVIVMGIIDRLYSFVVIRGGWKMWVSYKTQVVLTMINWVIPVFIYFFIGVTLGFGRLSAVRDYTAFMVIGTAFQGYFSASVTTLAGRIRNEELIGTLEYLMAAPLRPMALMMYNTVWGG
ncbi:hypothetical protein [Vulcanisaeta distributa]|uniref:hypothetical protein n=1 Tax=Vulcanisaeta distributa TaxID=164451 RepID=UPI000A768704|nr:hypothetical protein [Vulcanisaeta distributa]